MEFVRKGKPSKDPEGWKKFSNLMKEHNVAEWYIESAFTEVRWLAHKRMLDALPAIEKASADFAERFGRKSGGLQRFLQFRCVPVCGGYLCPPNDYP